jgi:hypothetical protein
MINFQQIAPIIAACATSGGIIFQIGKHSEKLDMIGLRVEAQEKKDEVVDHSIYEMISGIEILKNDITNIKEDIRDIKVYMEKNR